MQYAQGTHQVEMGFTGVNVRTSWRLAIIRKYRFMNRLQGARARALAAAPRRKIRPMAPR
jgi:hypothetical protein